MRVRFAMLIVALGTAFAGSIALGLERGATAATMRPSAAASAVAAATPEQRTGDVIVKFRRSIPLGDLAAALGDAQSRPRRSTAGSGLVLVKPKPGQSVDEAIASLAGARGCGVRRA